MAKIYEPCFTDKIAEAEAGVVIKHSYPCDCEICASRWVGVDENGET